MMESDDLYVGRKIQDLREKQALMQAELAEILTSAGVGWSRATLSKVERGERQVRLSEAPTVARVLGVGVSELLPGGSSLELVRARVEWAYTKALDELERARYDFTSVTNSLKSLRLLEALAAGSKQEFRVSISRDSFFFHIDIVEAPVHLRVEDALQIVGIAQGDIDEARAEAVRAFESWSESGELPSWFSREHDLDLGQAWYRKELISQRFMALFCEHFPNVKFAQDRPVVIGEWEEDAFDIETDGREVVIDGIDDFRFPESFTKLIRRREIEDRSDPVEGNEQ